MVQILQFPKANQSVSLDQIMEECETLGGLSWAWLDEQFTCSVDLGYKVYTYTAPFKGESPAERRAFISCCLTMLLTLAEENEMEELYADDDQGPPAA